MRKAKKEYGAASSSWLVTFSDLVTLLLTFFVLLLSMASMENVLLSRIRLESSGMQILNIKGSGKVSDRIQLIKEILENPQDIIIQKARLKDLLLPDTTLPPEVNKKEIKDDLDILKHPQGVVIVLTDRLVFNEGSYELTPIIKQVLNTMSEVLNHSSTDVNIAGHTDNTPYPNIDNYELAMYRCLAVMEYFLQQKHNPNRFSLSAYGPDKPLYPNDSVENKTKNRRIEILMKTTQWLGGYR